MHLLNALHNSYWLAHTNPIPSNFIYICLYSHQSLVGEHIHGNLPLDNMSTTQRPLRWWSVQTLDQLRYISLNSKSHTHTCISLAHHDAPRITPFNYGDLFLVCYITPRIVVHVFNLSLEVTLLLKASQDRNLGKGCKGPYHGL